MDSMGKVLVVMAAGGTVALIAKTIADAVIRYAELRRTDSGLDRLGLEERLDRIEIAVDAIAIEVERLGEHHRFNAQLALNRPDAISAKVVTPH